MLINYVLQMYCLFFCEGRVPFCKDPCIHVIWYTWKTQNYPWEVVASMEVKFIFSLQLFPFSFFYLLLFVRVVHTRGNDGIWLNQMNSRKRNLRQLAVLSCLVLKARVGTLYKGKKLNDKKGMPL